MFRSLRFRLLLMMVMVFGMAVGVVALFASQVTASEFEHYLTEGDLSEISRLEDVLASYYDQGQGWQNVGPFLQQIGQLAGQRITLTDIEGSILADSYFPDSVFVDFEWSFPFYDEWPLLIDEWLFDWPLVLSEERNFGFSSGTPSWMPPFEFMSGMGERMGERMSDRQHGNDPSPFVHFSPEGVTGAIVVSDYPVGLVHISSEPVGEVDEPAPAHLETTFINSVNRSLLVMVLAAGVGLFGLTFVLSRRILGPVEALTVAVRRMEGGDLGQRVEVYSKDEIGELAHAFNAMTGSLARAEQLRRNMVNDVAHELRTPLSNIRGYLEGMQDGIVEPKREVIDSLYEEAMLLNRLIDDLQELSLAEAGQLNLVRGEIALEEVITGVANGFRPTMADKNLTFTLDLPDNLPPVNADQERIGQVLRNLLGNAITHTPAGGKITVAARAVDGEIEVCVYDTGNGIAAEHLPYIFERFYRADSSRTRATGGAGLGLAIVRQLVMAHGGRVWAESAPGEGAAFCFMLPISVACDV